jgi:hypothetical protein
MITSSPPFSDEKPLRIFQNIIDKKFMIPYNVPPKVEDFIKRLMIYEPEDRMGAEDVC